MRNFPMPKSPPVFLLLVCLFLSASFQSGAEDLPPGFSDDFL